MQNQSIHEGAQYKNSATTGGAKFSMQTLLLRVKSIVFDPKKTWIEISNESTTAKDLYLNYIIPLAGFVAACQFLGSWLIGHTMLGMTYKLPFMSALGAGLMGFVTHVIAVYVAAFILSFLAPKFGGQASVIKSLQLVAYASTPNYLAAALYLFPALLVATLLFGLYSIYIFWLGIEPMTKVPSERKVPFTLVSVVAIIVTMFVIALISAPFAAGPTGVPL